VLDAITSLCEREPWSGHDDMEVEEVNAALRERDADAAGRVLELRSNSAALAAWWTCPASNGTRVVLGGWLFDLD
jgi:hypothetical protein